VIKRELERRNQSHKSDTRDTVFYPVVRPSNTCLLPRCGVPMDKGCTQPLSSDPMIHLNTTVLFLILVFPFVRNLHKLEPLTLTKLFATQSIRVREGKEHTQESHQTHTHTSQDVSTKHGAGSLQLRRCSNLKHNDPIVWLRSLGVLECSKDVWLFAPCT
jgi:hypothetical protein